MNRLITLNLLGIIVAIALLAGCGDSGGQTVDSRAFADQSVVVDFADQVIIPTYDLLDQRAQDLKAASATLANEPSQANLQAARQAWVAMRVPWEQSEAMLFGPVDANGYDPALDSWPVNRTDLDAVLAGDHTLDQAYVRSLDPSLKGFHTAEYLLFGASNDKNLDAFTDRELAYLKATTAEMARIAGLLASSWTDGAQPYRDVFATAGEAGNTIYPSVTAAGQQITQGIIDILGEVANSKMGGPYQSRDTTQVESQFSYNSLNDFANNVTSAKNAYLGQMSAAGTSGKGLADFVAARDPQLDQRVRDELDAAIAAIAAVPRPFRDAITDDAARPKVEAAIDAVTKVEETFEDDVKPLVLGQ